MTPKFLILVIRKSRLDRKTKNVLLNRSSDGVIQKIYGHTDLDF